jgi:lipopolysaccharide transport protein LptA|tara:strand:- start:689 stop:1138 length:450 start_codon:yes stop_codon:yes gene_type:complete
MIKKIFITILFILFTNSAYAKQIKIISDTLEIIRAENISIFSGNVYAIEDNLEVWSEKLIVTSSKDENEIKEINAKGNVKIVREEISINGDKALYDPIQNKLFVFGKVEVLQNQSIILCDKIILDLENSSSIMSSDTNKRVEALIINQR